MHSTAVRLLRSVVPFGLLALFATNLQGQTFRAVGTVSSEYPNIPEAPRTHRPFTAYVHNGSWLIRTTDTDPKSHIAYYEAAFNGMDGFMHMDSKPDPSSAGVITSSLTIDNSPVPDERMSPLIAPVWLALASADYFRKLTNAVITPLWTDGPTSQRVPANRRNPIYAATGKWKMTNQPPSILCEAAFYETAAWLTGVYKDGYLKQRYTVTTWTNLNGQVLPLESVLQGYGPKRLFRNGKAVLTDGKFNYVGKDGDDTEPFVKYKVVVSRYELGVKPARFVPALPEQTVVDDLRFSGRPNTGDGRFLLQYLLSDQQTATNGAVRLKPVPAPR